MPAKKKDTIIDIQSPQLDKDIKSATSETTKGKASKANTSTTLEKTKQTKASKEKSPKPVTLGRLELAKEVMKAVGEDIEITGQEAEAIVSEIIQSMIDSLKEGNKIEIRGFGSFRLRSRRARRGRNPKTGVAVEVPGKNIVYFKMGKDLKDYLKEQPISDIEYLLPEDFKVYTKNNGVINWPAPGFKEVVLPTVNQYMGKDGGYVAFYTRNKKRGVYSVGGGIYVVGQIRLKGSYIGRIFHPHGYVNQDISAAEEFKEMGKKIFDVDCWAGGDTGGWFGM